MEFIEEGFFQAFQLLFSGDEETWSAILTTVQLTGLSMLATLLIGLPLGFVLGYATFPGKKGLRTTVDTLLALPTVVVGLVVYAFISSRGPFGRYELLFTIRGMAIGQTILALPIIISLTASAIEALDRRLRLTLLTLGASGGTLISSILWEARYQVLAAVVTAYGRIIAEVGVSMMIGGNIKWHTRTITTAITLETGKGEFSMGIALGVVLLAMSFALNAALSLLRRRAEA